jgi:type II secretory pathway pseudopilin PulG
METKPRNPVRNSAFSLIELLAVVAAIAVIGAVAVSFISKTSTSLASTKLEQDVSRLNTTLKVFVANGGDLDDIETGNEVLTELKKSANAEGQKKIVGIRGTSIDNRLYGLDPTHPKGSNKSVERAVWKKEQGKFVVEVSSTGIEEFFYEEGLAHFDFGSQKYEQEQDGDRVRRTKLAYDDQDGWVWETLDRSFVTSNGPQSLPTLEAPTLRARGGSGAANSSRLIAPSISPDSGTLALASYPLQVSITKSPSDPSDATIKYSVEANTWITYSGPFYVEPGTVVQAFTTHADSSWENSEAAAATYNNSAETLEIALSVPKNPLTYAEAGGELEPGNYTPVAVLDPITISLPSSSDIPDKYENSDNFRIYWTLDGSDPITSTDRHGGSNFSNGYSGDAIDYTLPVWDGASLLPIQIVAQSTNATLVTNSNVHTANININVTDLPTPIASYNDTDTSRGDTIELEKIVDGGDMPVGARIYYTTDGSDPGDDGSGNPLTGTLYTGSFDPLVGEAFETEATIVARVYPPASYTGWFNVSDEVEIAYEVPAFEISGVSSGWFSNPIGPGSNSGSSGNGHSNNGHGNNIDGVDSSNPGQGHGGPNGQVDPSGDFDDEGGNGNAGGGNGNNGNGNNGSSSNSTSTSGSDPSHIVSGNHFQWGDPGNWGTGANWLQFDGASFEDVTDNERFQVGALSYYNGTISMDSIATSIDFAVDLDFGGTSNQFDFSFDLLTTPNSGNAWQNADYVSFNNGSVSAQTIELAGSLYTLNLEFGETSQYGSSSNNISQFHVQEAQSATANVYATLQAITIY